MPLTDVVAVTVDISSTTNPDDTPSWEHLATLGSVPVDPVESMVIGQRGRAYEQDAVTPTASTIRVDNTSGAFTSGAATSTGGTITTDRRVRVRAAVVGGATYTVADGTLSSCPTTIDGDGFGYASNTFGLIDYMDALGCRTLRSCYVESTLAENPDAYYTLGEKAPATSVGDLMGGPSVPLVAASYPPVALGGTPGAAAFEGTPLFAVVEDTTTLSLSAYYNTSTDQGGNYLLLGSNGQGRYLTGTQWAVRCSFATTTVNQATIFCQTNSQLVSDNLSKAVLITVQSGTVSVYYPSASGEQAISSGALLVNDGLEHIVEVVSNGTNVRLIIDGNLVATSSVACSSLTRIGPVAAFGQVLADNATALYFMDGRVGHLAFFGSTYATASLPTLQAHWTAAQGYVGESCETRIARVLSWVGYSGTTTLDAGVAILGPQACATKSAAQECADTALADSGIFYISTGGPRFRSRTSRYTASSLVTFGTSTLPVDTSGLVFDFDRTHMVNDLQATRVGGPTIRVVDETSVQQHRTRTLSGSALTLNVGSDEDLLQAAYWRVGLYSQPRVRVGKIQLRPSNFVNLMPWCLSLEPGDRITITNLPSNAPASTMDFIVEYVAHPQIDPTTWITELGLSPYVPVFTVGDATLGVVGDEVTTFTPPIAY